MNVRPRSYRRRTSRRWGANLGASATSISLGRPDGQAPHITVELRREDTDEAPRDNMLVTLNQVEVEYLLARLQAFANGGRQCVKHKVGGDPAAACTCPVRAA